MATCPGYFDGRGWQAWLRAFAALALASVLTLVLVLGAVMAVLLCLLARGQG